MSNDIPIINLHESGRDSTTLSVTVGPENALRIQLNLTDVQLTYLAIQAADIIKRRADNRAYKAIGAKHDIRLALDKADKYEED